MPTTKARPVSDKKRKPLKGKGKSAKGKVSSKKSTQVTSRPRLEKDEDGRSKELRNPQKEILAYLLKKKGSALRSDIGENCCKSLTEMIGPIREGASKNAYTVGLEEQKLVKQIKQEEGGILVSLTASGKKAAEKL